MIERLNFYDLYGYLLPGVALLGVWWLPLWLLAGLPLKAEWSSAVAVLLVGYVAGHTLYRVDRHAFRDYSNRAKSGRDPSDYLLDDSDAALSPELKARLKALVKLRFEVDVDRVTKPEDKLSAKRSEALLLCRRALIQRGVSSYAEQFQGLYALMRGLTAVGLISVCYHSGWWLGIALSRPLARPMFVMTAVITFTMLFFPERRWTFGLALLAQLPIGVMAAGHFAVATPRVPLPWVLIAIIVGSLFLSRFFFDAYKYFALEFVRTIYRDFVALGAPEKPGVGSQM